MKFFLRKILVNYLAWAAKKVIQKYQPFVIGITGSVGKTSTKEAVYAVLREKFSNRVFKAGSNLNSEIGLPLAILRYKRQPEAIDWIFVLLTIFLRIASSNLYPKNPILVLEYAADRPGDIEHLISLVPPVIGIVTEIGPAHLAQFKTIENVAKEKGKLIAGLPGGGLAILNRRNHWVYDLGRLTAAEKIYLDTEAEDLTEEIAKTIGRYFGLSKAEIDAGLKKINYPRSRLNIIDGKNGSIIIDDSYNANPLSMKLALKIMKKKAQELKAKRKIAVLGDMVDLGSYTEEAHLEIGKIAHRSVDLLIAIGLNSRLMDAHFWFVNPDRAANFLLSEIKSGDIILVKASRMTRLDKVVKKIKEAE